MQLQTIKLQEHILIQTFGRFVNCTVNYMNKVSTSHKWMKDWFQFIYCSKLLREGSPETLRPLFKIFSRSSLKKWGKRRELGCTINYVFWGPIETTGPPEQSKVLLFAQFQASAWKTGEKRELLAKAWANDRGMESKKRPTLEKSPFEVGQQNSFDSSLPHLSAASCKNPGIPHPLIITVSHTHTLTHTETHTHAHRLISNAPAQIMKTNIFKEVL